MSVRFAPSPTTISTFSESVAGPVDCRITVALLFGAAVTTVCPARGSVPRFERATVSSTCCSPATVTARAFSKCVQAFAEARSSGVPAEPTRSSARSTHSTVAPGASSASIS
jgi:hypothetical protein